LRRPKRAAVAHLFQNRFEGRCLWFSAGVALRVSEAIVPVVICLHGLTAACFLQNRPQAKGPGFYTA